MTSSRKSIPSLSDVMSRVTDEELQTIYKAGIEKVSEFYAPILEKDKLPSKLSIEQIKEIKEIKVQQIHGGLTSEVFDKCFERLLGWMLKHTTHDKKPPEDRNGWLYLANTLDYKEQLKALLLSKEIELRLIRKEKKERNIHVSSNTPVLDVNLAVTGNPKCFIKTIEPTKKSGYLKVIVNLPRLKVINDETMFKLTVQNPYLSNQSYIIFGKKDTDIANNYKIDMIPTNKIKEMLSEQHVNIQDFFILDYNAWNKLVNESYVINKYLLQNKPYVKFKKIENEQDLQALNFYKNIDEFVACVNDKKSAEILKNLSQSMDECQSMVITDFFMAEEPYEITLPNISNHIKEILLESNGCNKFVGSSFFKELEEMEMSAYNLEELDISQLTQLKKIIIKGNPILQKIKLNKVHRNLEFELTAKKVSKKTLQLIKYLAESGCKVTMPNISVVETKETKHSNQPKMHDSRSYREDPETMSSPTGIEPTDMNQQVSLKNSKGNISPSKYRIKVLTDFKMDSENKLVFTPFQFNEEKSTSINIENIAPIKREIFTESNLAADLDEFQEGSYIGVHSVSSQWAPLPGLSSLDKLIGIDEESIQKIKSQNRQLEIRYSNETQQYFVRTAPLTKNENAVSEKPVNLHYAMVPDPYKQNQTNIKSIELSDKLKKAMDYIFSESFIKDAPNEFKNHTSNLQSLKETINNKKAIEGLTYFCSQCFKDKKIDGDIKQFITKKLASINIDDPSVIDFMTCLFANAGVCEHRAKVFMVLANYFNVPARVVTNDVHAFVEYFDGKSWSSLDLGGGRVHNFNTSNLWNDAASEIKQEQEKKECLEIASTISQEQPESKDTTVDLFPADEIKLDESVDFKTWSTALLKLDDHPLLEFKDENDAFWLHSQLMACKENKIGENYFYIHQPSDFDKLLYQLKVDSNGDYQNTEGPLLKMLAKGPGTILINWSRFSERQIANYKSILDSTPTLQGHPLSKSIKIINISKAHTEACSAFYSRTAPVIWPSKLSSIKEEYKEVETTKKEAAIDLYQSRNWENRLLGKVKIQGDTYSFNEGLLLDAVKQKKGSLTLTGVPTTQSFKIFLERLKREKGFYANGAWHTLPNNFQIYIEPFNKPQPSIKVFQADSKESKSEIFYVNKQNFYQYFETHQVDSEGKVTSLGGLLKHMPKKSKLVITDSLDAGQYRELIDEIKEHDKLELELSILPHLQASTESKEQEVKTIELTKTSSPTQSSVVITNDIDAATRMIAQEKDSIVDMSASTEYADLFENSTLQSAELKKCTTGNRKLRFDYHMHELTEKLLAGNRVILKGNISNELYHQLETLFSQPPYLVINGERKQVKGQLVLVVPENKHQSHLFNSVNSVYEHRFTWAKAKAYLKDKMNLSDTEMENYFRKIRGFFDIASELDHNGKTTPPELILTEDRVLQIALAMKNHPKSSNPIEHIFHHNYSEDPKILSILTEAAKKHLSSVIDDEKSVTPHYQVQTKQVHHFLEIYPYVELRGSPGTGKTHFIEHELSKSEDIEPFWGEDKIIEWLAPIDKQSKKTKHYLLLDEANMKVPGYWDFLKGLSDGKIYYKGKFYNVSPQTHKIIFTGNPETYPGRYYHAFLEQVPKVYFKSHTDEYLRDDIIMPVLAEKAKALKYETRNEISRCFIAAYHTAKKMLPYESIGIRDLKAMLDHLLSADVSQETIAKSNAFMAAVEVFAGVLKNDNAREAYINEIKKQFNIDKLILEKLPQHNKDYILPASRQLLWNNVSQCIAGREKSLQSQLNLTRRGMLVEGPSGIGKSEMMLQSLIQRGYTAHDEKSEEKEHNKKMYFHLTMGSENISEMLLKAFHLGAVVVIDELNLLTEKDEALLTHLLEGRTPGKEKAKHEGFCVLASQNSQLYAGRKPLSYALLSRLDRFYEQAYTEKDLLEIGLNSKKFKTTEIAKKFVNDFLAKHKTRSHQINVRNFFTRLKKIPSISETTTLPLKSLSMFAKENDKRDDNDSQSNVEYKP